MKIVEVIVTPIAIPDVPLANTKGVHPSVFLRAVIQMKTDTGLTGLGEAYGTARTLTGLQTVAPVLQGLDPYNLRELRRRVETALPQGGGVNAPTALADHKVVDVVYSAYEIALLDIRGKEVGRPLYDLLGGAVRKTIPFGGYLFYKFCRGSTTVLSTHREKCPNASVAERNISTQAKITSMLQKNLEPPKKF